MYWSELAWLIPILPLISFVLVGFLGNKLFKRAENGGYVAILMAAAACFLSLMVAYEILSGGYPGGLFKQSLNWMSVPGFTFNMGIYIDNLTALMLIVVSFVATLVVIYSVGYMHEEGEKKRRYYAIISLFIGVMLGLVLASNFLQMFIFWELVGLCSYLLIGFWYTKPSAASAAKKAFLVTRIGDIMFMLGLFILFVGFQGNLDFDYIFNNVDAFVGGNELLTLGTFFIFGGAIGKSAQFPLHDWLPDAMEGPTTVSALIHAATMVKAGVYLVARSYPVMVETPDTMLIIAVIGGITALMAATMALNNPNIKRVLAYSTISQLGYMFLALGTGGYLFFHTQEANVGYTAGMFHLMNHAFFKALLFLSAGAFIHAVHTEDMRLMGGLGKKLKITKWVMLMGCISIAGIPVWSGFFSKDEILAVVFETGAENPLFYLLYIMGVLTAFMTAFYMFRLWFMTFTGEPRDHHAYDHAHEAPKVMWVPLAILAVLAVVSGLVGIFLGFENLIVPTMFHAHEATPIDVIIHTFEEPLTYVSIAVAVLGIALAYLMYYRKTINPDAFVATPARRKVYDLLLARYGFTAAYDWIGLKLVYGLSKVVDLFDRKVIDGIVNGFAAVTTRLGNFLRRGQTGFVQSYAALVVAGVSVIVILLIIFGGLI
ncbi:MAG: NADH-quinone oxidoreductase subunit L [Methanomassiliicoccus sp.]|nr:NADH-quinone oxidoreductase subunit L [Methanomassiliicoccus sp.]